MKFCSIHIESLNNIINIIVFQKLVKVILRFIYKMTLFCNMKLFDEKTSASLFIVLWIILSHVFIWPPVNWWSKVALLNFPSRTSPFSLSLYTHIYTHLHTHTHTHTYTHTYTENHTHTDTHIRTHTHTHTRTHTFTHTFPLPWTHTLEHLSPPHTLSLSLSLSFSLTHSIPCVMMHQIKKWGWDQIWGKREKGRNMFRE